MSSASHSLKKVFTFVVLASSIFTCSIFAPGQLHAQEDCDCIRMVPQTVYEQRPITVSRTVNETVFETKKVTTYKPVWSIQKRERVRVTHKPVIKTSEREETYRVYRPVVETKYREREIKETSYETTTEMREEKYRVRRPVIEVEYRQQDVCVRRPVTETRMKTENVTTYKPVNIRESALVPGVEYENRWVMDRQTRRLRWLPRGCYLDPNTGDVVFRSSGLRWVPNQNVRLQQTARPTLELKEFDRTAYVPETVQKQTPIDITRYVDEVQTRKYPVQVQRTKEEMHVVKVPYKVHRPVTKTKTERIPYEQVTYKLEQHVRKVPVTETKWERVETVTPYEKRVCRWVAETKEIRVPKTVCRVQDYEITETTARQVMRKAPVYNNPQDPQLALARRIDSDSIPTYVLPMSEAIRIGGTDGDGRKTSNRLPTPMKSILDPTKKTLETSGSTSKDESLDFYGTPIFVKERGSSILVEENQTTVKKPMTGLTTVAKPVEKAVNASEVIDPPLTGSTTLPEVGDALPPSAQQLTEGLSTIAGPEASDESSDIDARPDSDGDK